MNILFATGIYPPDAGGPATYVRALAKALIAGEHRAEVVTYAKNGGMLDDGGLSVHRVSRSSSAIGRYLRFMRNVRDLSGRFDLVSAMGPVSEGFPAVLGASFNRTPVCMKVVGDFAWEQYMQTGSNALFSERSKELLDEFVTHRHGGKTRVHEWIERYSVKRAKRVIVPSRYLANIVELWGVDAAKIVVIPNAIHPMSIDRDRESLRREKGLEDTRLLFTAARAVPWKGVDGILEILKELPMNVQYAIAGDGPDLVRWKSIAHACGVEERVRFLGNLDRSMLARWYAMADLFLLPSGYEGFPHVIPEAVMMGTPCFVSDRGGNPETQELLGIDAVRVLPYADRSAWKSALLEEWPKRVTIDFPPALRFDRMVQTTLETYEKCL